MTSVGRYDFRIVTDGKLFKPQRSRRIQSRWWWSQKPHRWEDLTSWGVPLQWAKDIINEQIDIEEREQHGWVEVDESVDDAVPAPSGEWAPPRHRGA